MEALQMLGRGIRLLLEYELDQLLQCTQGPKGLRVLQEKLVEPDRTCLLQGKIAFMVGFLARGMHPRKRSPNSEWR